MQQPPQYPYGQQPQNPYPAGNFGQPPPPPPKQPGRLSRFLSWYRAASRPMQIVVALGILAATIFVCSAAVSGIVESATGAALTPTAQVDQPTPTSAPTQVPTPTNTPTVKQNIIQLVNAKASQATKIDFLTNDGKTVVVTVTLSEMATTGFARDAIQSNCFDIEQSLWTAHIASLKDVNLAFRGPSVDKFGNKSTAPYGECNLSKATAAKFNWGNLDSSSAWNAYDQAVFYNIIAG